MVRKLIIAVLIATIGVLAGCGMSKNEDFRNNKVQEIPLIDAQNHPDNEETGAQTQASTQNESQTQVSISIENARELALARVTGATENDIWIELDFDDGYYVYEGEILYEQKEYEFEIDANTGTFLEWSEEQK